MTSASDIRARITIPAEHGHHVDLTGITCSEPLNLDGMEICGVDLTGATFEKAVSARAARFDGLCWWRDVTFGAGADFTGAQFMNDARFEDSRFARAATFDRCEFRGIAKFDRIRADAGLSMKNAESYGNASLEDGAIRGAAHFDGTEWLGGLWCDGTDLPPDTTFSGTQVHGRLWIKRGHTGNAVLAPGHFDMIFGHIYA